MCRWYRSGKTYLNIYWCRSSWCMSALETDPASQPREAVAGKEFNHHNYALLDPHLHNHHHHYKNIWICRPQGRGGTLRCPRSTFIAIKTNNYCSLKFYFFWVVWIALKRVGYKVFNKCFNMSDTKPVLQTLLCSRRMGSFKGEESQSIDTCYKCFDILYVCNFLSAIFQGRAEK